MSPQSFLTVSTLLLFLLASRRIRQQPGDDTDSPAKSEAEGKKPAAQIYTESDGGGSSCSLSCSEMFVRRFENRARAARSNGAGEEAQDNST